MKSIPIEDPLNARGVLRNMIASKALAMKAKWVLSSWISLAIRASVSR